MDVPYFDLSNPDRGVADAGPSALLQHGHDLVAVQPLLGHQLVQKLAPLGKTKPDGTPKGNIVNITEKIIFSTCPAG